MQNSEIILVNITGADKPGITSALTHILGKYNAKILDIGQANIHHSLSLALIFMSKNGNSGNILKEILFKANELNINVRFSALTQQEYSDWVKVQGKNRYIIHILGKELNANQISIVSEVLLKFKLNIERIIRLTQRIPLNKQINRTCFEFAVRGNLTNIREIQKKFLIISSELNIDIALQEENKYRRMRRLICFDMDSTLIQTEVIDELAEKAGVGKEVKAITESAMNGEIDFCESFKRRIKLLKGLDQSILEKIAKKLPITEGLERLMIILKKSGYKTAIISGGFTYFGNYLKEKFGFDYVFANTLDIVDGKLTGKYIGDIVDGKKKAEYLKFLAQKENIDIQQTVAVGDGANDLPMLSIAGLGIAFHAKKTVKENAKHSLSTIGLDGILYFLGYKDSSEDIEMLNIS
ncbi:phosphoserine phosphatase SerB [Apibacter adventoris]|uniref:phosphoserine phosphatase SerB n=1 Tax=Apibacter adventoris TaxID=1679466 RepID=UPI000CF67D46|nr:phosphoserine phosphatase SerB [Apibacter adventoris]PQL93706.1 phosphoserine phosphatase SerB [Apibacter adventoris]